MNPEKFTEKSLETLQQAQILAASAGNPELLPVHLLKSLIEDADGLAVNLLARTGASVEDVRKSTEATLSRLPKVAGGNGSPAIGRQAAKVLTEAEKLADKAGDRYVPAERVLNALAYVRSEARDILERGGRVRPKSECHDQ